MTELRDINYSEILENRGNCIAIAEEEEEGEERDEQNVAAFSQSNARCSDR